ncbi:MAG TPA: hypothetical protein VG963_23360 [Polyangiaceae bacterium]|nr:hypothetical protein [Polyangiaceae bacterium]
MVAPPPSNPNPSSKPNDTGSGGTGAAPTTGSGGDVFGGDLSCLDGCAFSTTPILDTNVSASDITPFSGSKDFSSSSVCVVEPQLSTPDGTPGALFPSNWLRPRFRWVSSGGETLWEIRLHADSQPDDQLIYTKDTQWLVPKDMWAKMATLDTVTVTIRGLGAGGVKAGATGDFQIAPVLAGGSMVFWTTSSSIVDAKANNGAGASRLRGFSVGDEGVVETLSPADVQNPPSGAPGTTNIPGEDGAEPRGFYACGGNTPRPTCTGSPNDPANCCTPTNYTFGDVECIGCHVSTPDGKAVLFTDNWPWDKVAASIESGSTGALPGTVTRYAADLLKQPWLGMQAMSSDPSVFSTNGPRILVTTYGRRASATTKPYDNVPPTVHDLAWFDLSATDPNPLPANQTAPIAPGLMGFPEYTVNPMTPNAYQDPGKLNAAVGKAETVAWGLINTIGETRSAVTPAWSNDAKTIAYVSVDVSSTDGHPDWTANAADIHLVAYNNHAGGNMAPLQGASDPNFLEYYPAFSSDDSFIAFTRAPKPSNPTRCVPTQDTNGNVKTCGTQNLGDNPDGPYYNRNGEIWIVPSAGSPTPTRLIANDPVSCTGETVKGSINSWPKWSPRIGTANGKHYYFLIFSSARNYPGSWELPPARLTPDILHKSSQLYMASIVVDDATGAITTYPAIYLWNQNIVVDANGNATIDPNTSNLTPAWNDFSIPPVPPPVTIPR